MTQQEMFVLNFHIILCSQKVQKQLIIGDEIV